MRKKTLIMLLFLSCLCNLRGQVWTNLIDSIPQQGWADFKCAVVDSVNNNLYIGGQFYHFNQYNTNSIIKYNGITFDTLQSGLDPQDSVQTVVTSMQMFQNKLYVFGTFKKTGKYWCSYIGRWNGASWDTINFRPNSMCWNSDVYNNELYVQGYFDTIGGIASNCIAKYDGSNWHSLSHPIKQNIISAMKNYDGRLYIAGQVTNASSSANLSYWDGTQWMPWVGVSGDNNKAVFGMNVIDSMLYVYGRFNSIAGTNCRGLAAYNGKRWYGFGVGLSNSSWETIYNVQKVNGEIYISGNYNTIEDVSTAIPSQQMYTQLVKFDGTKFCTLGPPFGNVVTGVVGYKNNLYGLGAFTKIGNDSVWGFVRRDSTTTAVCSSTFSIYASTVGVKEIINFSNLKIYPNPAKDKLTIEFTDFETSNCSLELISPLGQVLYTKDDSEPKEELDLKSFPAGIYYLKVQSHSNQKVFKIIKE